jgi:hypothetical protein
MRFVHCHTDLVLPENDYDNAKFSHMLLCFIALIKLPVWSNRDSTALSLLQVHGSA